MPDSLGQFLKILLLNQPCNNGEVVEDRRGEEDAVESVQHSTVSGQKYAGIFDTCKPLHY